MLSTGKNDTTISMKYIRFKADGVEHYGALIDGKAWEGEGTPFSTFRLTERCHSMDSIRLLPPVQCSKALCIGLNYRDHAEEFGLPIPETPVVFMKPSTSLIGMDDEIIYPEMCHRLDYEAELAVVIGRECHHVKEEEASRYILGYTIANDVTARDLQPKNGQWTVSKSFDTFLPLGPYISDEVDPGRLRISSRVNGAVKQMSDTSNLIFSVPYLVSYLSNVMTLLPGDIISTGTPGGISGMNVGDVVEIEIEGLGVLRNRIAR